MKAPAHTSPTREAPARKGGRPRAQDAQRIEGHIVQVARQLFLAHGYGATSVEAIAQAAGISKRTFYTRFADKQAVFGAVVHDLIESLRPAQHAELFAGKDREALLLALANVILAAALRPESLALHRIMVGEVVRFPELATVMKNHGARREAVERIGQLLQRTAPKKMTRRDAEFAAEQFLELVVAVPQKRAIGLGEPMRRAELARWARQAVALFLNGIDG